MGLRADFDDVDYRSNGVIEDSCWGFRSVCPPVEPYGFLSGAWPFGVVEIIWSDIARYAGVPGNTAL